MKNIVVISGIFLFIFILAVLFELELYIEGFNHGVWCEVDDKFKEVRKIATESKLNSSKFDKIYGMIDSKFQQIQDKNCNKSACIVNTNYKGSKKYKEDKYKCFPEKKQSENYKQLEELANTATSSNMNVKAKQKIRKIITDIEKKIDKFRR
jgi:hypothetical protein